MFSKFQLHVELGSFHLSSFLTHFYIIYFIISFSSMKHSLCADSSPAPQTCNLKIFISEKWSGLHHLKVACMNYMHVITFRPLDPQTEGDWTIRKSWDLAVFSKHYFGQSGTKYTLTLMLILYLFLKLQLCQPQSITETCITQFCSKHK